MEGVIKERDGVGGGEGAVVEVAGDDDGVGTGFDGEVDELAEDVGLVVEEGVVAEDAAQVPVGGMQEAH